MLTGASRVEGFEASVAGRIAPFWEANLGYTYLDGEIRSDTESGSAGERLQQLPQHQVGLWNHFDLTDALGLGLGVVHQSQQFASISHDVVLPASTRVDAAAYYAVNDRLTLQVNADNLFDTNYYPSAHGDNNIQPGDPFRVRFGVRLSL